MLKVICVFALLCFQAVVKRVIDWRQQHAAESKEEEAQKAIIERREEHQRQHREEMRVRHEAGFVRSNRKRMQKTKEIVESQEGPQFSLVLKGSFYACGVKLSWELEQLSEMNHFVSSRGISGGIVGMSASVAVRLG